MIHLWFLYFMEKLQDCIEGIHFNGESGSLEKGLPNIINICFPTIPDDISLLDRLNNSGIAVSSGSACSNISIKGSRVLKALNCNVEKENIRFSFSKYNSITEIDLVVEKLSGFYRKN